MFTVQLYLCIVAWSCCGGGRCGGQGDRWSPARNVKWSAVKSAQYCHRRALPYYNFVETVETLLGATSTAGLRDRHIRWEKN